MTEEERCQHPDCIYRNKNASDHGMTNPGNCNFLTMTGRSRIKGLPDRLQLPCNCIEYIPDRTATAAMVGMNWEERARKLYNAGATDNEIAQATGVKYDRVNRWRRRQGMPIHRDKKGPAPAFDWKKAMELYRHGASDVTIAREIGCSVRAVWHWRFKCELIPNGTTGRKKDYT